MIEAKHLTRRYGDFTAVEDVSFSIARGSIVGLLGHNGAGKTTIMKMLTGALEPSAGTVTIDGLGHETHGEALRARLGYLPENCPLWPEMTVLETLAYGAELHGLSAAAQPKALARAIEATDLGAKLQAPVGTLSRGYRQRLGVACAILHRPELIILDEPTNGLDPTQILQMRALIQRLAEDATVLVSTHILQEVQAVCERVLIMRQGRLAFDSALSALTQAPTLTLRTGQAAHAVLTPFGDLEEDPAQPFSYRLTLSESESESDGQAAAVASALAAAAIPLYAMTPERQDLETLFTRVTQEGGAHHG
ncbi:MAG: ABC transporter ATP-binding protein [Gammaproteobacteria bacterium]|nr:ABC transporter ATP-binding protein [Gammaproteobacteria bacterium]